MFDDFKYITSYAIEFFEKSNSIGTSKYQDNAMINVDIGVEHQNVTSADIVEFAIMPGSSETTKVKDIL